MFLSPQFETLEISASRANDAAVAAETICTLYNHLAFAPPLISAMLATALRSI
jgi:hypothetical protein